MESYIKSLSLGQPPAGLSLPPPHPAALASTHFLPALSHLCSNFSSEVLFPRTGSPSPWAILTSAGLRNWYQSTDPWVSACVAAFWLSMQAWLLGEATGNVSIIDRLWTFLPVLFSAHFCFYPLFTAAAAPPASYFPTFGWLSGSGQGYWPSQIDSRMLLVFGLQVLWSIRLTTNTIRRGFFTLSAEDYRWIVLRERVPKWLFKLISFFFIAHIQVYLLLVTALPQYLILTSTAHPTHPAPPLGTPDLVLSAIFVSILAVEMVADNQQQAYQRFKRDPAYRASVLAQPSGPQTARRLAVWDASLRRGFVTSGLFGWSRHPNFACEQATWWCLWAFTWTATRSRSASTGIWAAVVAKAQQGEWPELAQAVKAVAVEHTNYAVVGPLSMTVLFYASTLFTEDISSSKYLLYKDYQKTTDMFWPPLSVLRSGFWAARGRRRELHERVFGVGASGVVGGGKAHAQ